MTIPTNTSNIPGYLGYVERAFNQGTIDSSSGEGVLQNYPISAFDGSIVLNNSQVVNGGQAAWTFGLLDVIAASNPQVQYQVLANYLSGTVSAPFYVADAGFVQPPGEFYSIPPPNVLSELLEKYQSQYPGFDITGQGDTSQNTYGSAGRITFGSLGMDPGEISQWYQSNAFNASTWNTAAFWDNPANQQIKAFWQVIQAALGNTSALTATPPSSFNEFYTTLQKLQVVTAQGDVPAQDTLGPAIVQTAIAPNFSATGLDPSSILQTLFGNYIQNYVSIISNLLQGTGITDTQSIQAFATGWYKYIQQGFTTPSGTPTTIPIYLTDPSGSYNVPLGQSIPTPNYQSNVQIVPTMPVSLDTFVTNFVNGIQADFANQINFNQDFSGINLPPGTSSSSLFESNFKTFMNYLLQQGGSTAISSYSSFIQQWNSFVGPTTILDPSGNANSQSIQTYAEIYNVFYPPGTPQNGEFLQNLTTFINGFLSQPGGNFNPSLMVDQWFKNMVKDVYGSQVESTPTSLDAANFENVRILNQLYRHLAGMVQNIQELTVAQATRLNLYTSLQQSYTDLMLKVPVVVTYGSYGANQTYYGNSNTGNQAIWSGTAISSNSAEDSQRRADVNALSAQYIENLRSFRSQAADMGSKFQASFSQSNQAVNQEASIATQILKLVTAIATSIFSKQQGNG